MEQLVVIDNNKIYIYNADNHPIFDDEDGYNGINYDYSECDLEQAVRDQVTLPNSIGEFNDWVEDDFEVNLEE